MTQILFLPSSDVYCSKVRQGDSLVSAWVPTPISPILREDSFSKSISTQWKAQELGGPRHFAVGLAPVSGIFSDEAKILRASLSAKVLYEWSGKPIQVQAILYLPGEKPWLGEILAHTQNLLLQASEYPVRKPVGVAVDFQLAKVDATDWDFSKLALRLYAVSARGYASLRLYNVKVSVTSSISKFVPPTPPEEADVPVEASATATVKEVLPRAIEASRPSTSPIRIQAVSGRTSGGTTFGLSVVPDTINVFADAETGTYTGEVVTGLKVTPGPSLFPTQDVVEVIRLRAEGRSGSVPIVFEPKGAVASESLITITASPNTFIRDIGSYDLTSKITVTNNSHTQQGFVISSGNTSTTELSFSYPSFTLSGKESKEIAVALKVTEPAEAMVESYNIAVTSTSGQALGVSPITLNLTSGVGSVDDFIISTSETITLTRGSTSNITLSTDNAPSGSLQWFTNGALFLHSHNLQFLSSGIIHPVTGGITGPVTSSQALIWVRSETGTYAAKLFTFNVV